jgi:hypothetical protein
MSAHGSSTCSFSISLTLPRRALADGYSGLFGGRLPACVPDIRKEFVMSKFDMDAVEKMELLAHLEAILGSVRTLHANLGALMADVAVIRDTVFNDAEELALYKNNLRSAVAMAKPMVDDAARFYDDLIEEIAATQRWEN